MAWLILFIGIVLEVVGTTSMKLSEGLTRPFYSVMMFVCYALSLGAIALALKELEVSLVYAIWAGLGTALIAAIGVVYFHEPLTALKLLSIGLIIAGVVGLGFVGVGR
ncbi:MAG: multidrug efflux SMR transporter [Anaerolineae bacterium]|nr:multidrug efflux SMR transporter [Anaerolineae bacterium]MCB9130800.1 multidrug efflux SMR transporter [Anaerolineales bacterium]MCB0228063.1 multidrug efflux SMR transporter [Anaerolineae bacterium]MCB0234093.1 multidrug efflux SMR transporter [Anaerolineae bacterium]MCB0240285.1 multidrug efflux SMR transporter [Anaerolineae bacterium]